MQRIVCFISPCLRESPHGDIALCLGGVPPHPVSFLGGGVPPHLVAFLVPPAVSPNDPPHTHHQAFPDRQMRPRPPAARPPWRICRSGEAWWWVWWARLRPWLLYGSWWVSGRGAVGFGFGLWSIFERKKAQTETPETYLPFGRQIHIIINLEVFERYPEETPWGNHLIPGNP